MNVVECIKKALQEDKPTLDVTSALLLSEPRQAEAHIIAKAHGVFFGQPIVDAMNLITPPSLAK